MNNDGMIKCTSPLGRGVCGDGKVIFLSLASNSNSLINIEQKNKNLYNFTDLN